MTTAEPAVSIDELGAFFTTAFDGGVPWTIERIGRGSASLLLATGDRDLRPGGTVSGPALMMLADSAAYVAVLTRIGLESLAVTANLNINFLSRPRPGMLRADAELLSVGRTLSVIDVAIVDVAASRQIAHASVTYSLALVSNP